MESIMHYVWSYFAKNEECGGIQFRIPAPKRSSVTRSLNYSCYSLQTSGPSLKFGSGLHQLHSPIVLKVFDQWRWIGSKIKIYFCLKIFNLYSACIHLITRKRFEMENPSCCIFENKFLYSDEKCFYWPLFPKRMASSTVKTMKNHRIRSLKHMF